MHVDLIPFWPDFVHSLITFSYYKKPAPFDKVLLGDPERTKLSNNNFQNKYYARF